MTTTDYISIGLGIISVVLGIYSVWQSKRYKVIGDKIEEYKDLTNKIIREKIDFLAITTREMFEKSYKSNELNLHKDELYIYKNNNYKACNASDIIDKLNVELPKVCKLTYIESVMAFVNLDEEINKKVHIATLRHQYGMDDLHKIKELNETFLNDGISFEIKIS